jgi:hypothetical protein
MVMEKIVAGLAMAGLAAGAHAETVTFDGDRAGAAPAGWICGSTGGGTPRWTVEPDPTAPSPSNVLKQSGSAPFPWCVKQGTAIDDGAVEVKFKPLTGREDQAGGVVWRWKDGDNYYVARANALEDNVRFYRVVDGRREQLGGANLKVTPNEWHTLGLRAEGERFTVSYDGNTLFGVTDRTFSEAGGVALWTKADSVTRFDRLTVTTLP